MQALCGEGGRRVRLASHMKPWCKATVVVGRALCANPAGQLTNYDSACISALASVGKRKLGRGARGRRQGRGGVRENGRFVERTAYARLLR